MRSRPALKLPMPRELTTNKVGDIQDHFRLWREEMDKQWRLLFQDVAVIQVDTDGWIYFGGKDVTGSARIGLVGTDWVCQHYIAGAYASRLGSSP
ncbi:hypothetical protein LCGC14_0390520 [marine sediment metagenome]|uniref:Uncharacterized protein n=1 Tax=marine sediment metagenome TaxID=412755 RepID=A0A0F9THQ5_9ZZZZ